MSTAILARRRLTAVYLLPMSSVAPAVLNQNVSDLGTVLTALCIAVSAAGAAEPDQVTLDSLVEAALKSNPEITAAQKALEASRQRPSQAGALPDPVVTLSYNSVGSPRPFAGIGTDPVANAGGMIEQEFPFLGKRGLRRDIARREADAAAAQYETVRLDVIGRLKQAYYRLSAAYASADVLERDRDVLRRFLRITEIRYSVGSAAQQDVFKAQTQLSILETRLRRLRQDIDSRTGDINALLNREVTAPLGRPVPVDVRPLRLSLDALLERARAEAPSIGREQRMAQRAELATNLARKELYPDFKVGAGVYSMGSMGEMYVGQFSFTLPVWAGRKQRAGIAEQVAEATRARSDYQGAIRNLSARVNDDYATAETSLDLMRAYSTAIIPQSNLALESSLASYETGMVDFLSVLSNFTTSLEYELNVIEERLNYLLAVSRIEQTTGIDPTK